MKGVDFMKRSFILLLAILSIVLVACTNNPSETGYNNLFNDGLLGVCNFENECGYLNEDFELEIPLEYSFVGRFYHGIALVGHYNDCGVINASNEVIVPLEYETASFNYDYELIRLFKDGESYYFDFDGNELTYREAHLKQGFSEDTLFHYSIRHRYTTTGGYETVFGYKNIDGDVVIEATYDSIYDYYFTDSTIVKKGSYYVTLTDAGDASNYFCSQISYSYYDGYISIRGNNNRWGISDMSGNITLNTIYTDHITLNENGYGIVETEDELFGIVSYNGEFILEPTYNVYGGSFEANKYHEKGFIIFYDETTYYLYNDFGNLIYTSEDIICDMFHDYVIMRDDETYDYYIVDLEGNEILNNLDYYDYDKDKNYIFFKETPQLGASYKIFDKDMDLIDLEFDFSPRQGHGVDNRSDDAFLCIRNYDTDELFLYNSKNKLIKTFAANSIYIVEDVIIYDDGYISYYQPDLTLVILNHSGDEIYIASENKYLIKYEHSYLWTH